MRPHVKRLSLLSLLVLTSACASTQGGAGQRVARNVITQDQIAQNRYRTAYEAVEALRAAWLINRPDGLAIQREKLVYLDERRLGGVETLREIAAAQIVSIRFIDPAAAVNRWGVDHSQGVIMVQTRR